MVSQITEQQGFSLNQIVAFIGYDDSVPEANRLYEEGQLLRIELFKNDADLGIVAQPVNEDHTDDPEIEASVVFADELSFLEEDEPDDELEEEPEAMQASQAGEASEDGAATQPAILADTEPAPKPKKAATSKPKKATEPATEPDKALSPEEIVLARKARKAAKDKARRAKNKALKEAAKSKTTAEPSKAAPKTGAKSKKAEPEQTDLEDAVANASQITTNPEDRVDPEAEQQEAAEELGKAIVAQMTSVEEILAQYDAIQAADVLINRAEKTYFTLGGVLAHIYHRGEFKSIGFKTKRGWNEYIDKRLGMHYRKVMDLIKIYEKFMAAGISEDDLVEFGWSKARLLARISVEDLVRDWDELKGWHEKTREQITDGIEKKYDLAKRDSSPEQVANVKVRVTLTGEAGETVERAFDVAKGFAESDEEAAILEYICGEWLAMHEAVDTPIEEMISYVEKRYQVTLKLEGSDGEDTVEGSVSEDEEEDEYQEE